MRVDYAYHWDELPDLARMHREQPFHYFILYPLKEEKLASYVDSVTAYFGEASEMYYSAPSTVDYILHILNPRHNRTNEAWLYRWGGEMPGDSVWTE
jgi:hypothetical protein